MIEMRALASPESSEAEASLPKSIAWEVLAEYGKAKI